MVVQKSENGIYFTTIGSLKGAGNSTTENKYAFEDFDLNQTVVYYRLKQINFDGTFDYSKTISVNRKGKVDLYPNPTNGDITVKLEGPIADDWIISFTDLSRRDMTSSLQKLKMNLNQVVFSIYALKKGYYLVKVVNGN
jgi:hypothetical protein